MSEDTQMIYNVLMDIKGDVGAVKAITQSTQDVLTQHIRDDQALTERVRLVELAQAKGRGTAKAYSVMGGIAGAVLGAAGSVLAEYLASIWRH